MWRICALDSETCDATEPSANNAGIQCVVGIGQAKGGNFQPTDVDLYLSGWLCVRVVNSLLLATNCERAQQASYLVVSMPRFSCMSDVLTNQKAQFPASTLF